MAARTVPMIKLASADKNDECGAKNARDKENVTRCIVQNNNKNNTEGWQMRYVSKAKKSSK